MSKELVEELQSEIKQFHGKLDKLADIANQNNKDIAVIIKHQKYQNGGLGEAVREFKDYVAKADEIREKDRKTMVCEHTTITEKVIKQNDLVTNLKIQVYAVIVTLIGMLTAAGWFIINNASKFF